MSHTELNRSGIFETGLYTVGEVSRLTHVHPQRISRWMRGYSYQTTQGKKSQNPVWNPETPRVDGMITLGFNDLLEIRFVDALIRNHKIALSKIRRAVSELRDMLGEHYPFSNQTVFVYRKKLITELRNDTGGPLFIELSGSKQTIFYSTTLPELEKGLEFDNGRVRRWRPNPEKYPKIIINPRVLFGSPVIEGTRLSAEFIYDAYNAEGSHEIVADWYGIETTAVRQAVSFHRQIAA